MSYIYMDMDREIERDGQGAGHSPHMYWQMAIVIVRLYTRFVYEALCFLINLPNGYHTKRPDKYLYEIHRNFYFWPLLLYKSTKYYILELSLILHFILRFLQLIYIIFFILHLSTNWIFMLVQYTYIRKYYFAWKKNCTKLDAQK